MMEQSPDKLHEWFKMHKNKMLTIFKVEDGDLDMANIKLRDIKLVQHKDPDDYLSARALLLRGEGMVRTSSGMESLPGQTFEIALTDQWSSETHGHSLHLYTERGNYTIELDGSL